jgi:hypothetical protein
MDFSYLDFTGSLLILGVFSVCVAITLCRFLLAKLEMPPSIALGDQSPGRAVVLMGAATLLRPGTSCTEPCP